MMNMNNQTILNQIVNPQEQIAFKNMRTDMETGKALLNPEQLGTFLRAAQINNTILNMADFKLMKSYEKQLNRVGINGRVLQNGYKTNGDTNDEITDAEITFGANTLLAKKYKASFTLADDDKEDNLEQEQFEQTLFTMMGERIGEDQEFTFVFGDSTLDKTQQPLLSSMDGWIKKAGNQLKSKGVDSSNGQFDIADGVENMFDKMIYNIGVRFRDKSKLAFFVPFEVEDAYRNVLGARQTSLGDTNTIDAPPLTYKKIPVIYCPTLDAEDGQSIDNTATSILTQPKNMAYGMYKDVSIEPERKAGPEETKYWYRLRADCDYYFRQASVTAKITIDENVALPAASRT